MKKFLIDTYRIFLLQLSKVIWDIVGWTMLIWGTIIFLPIYSLCQLSTMVPYSGIWIVIRLHWHDRKEKIEETEALRPISPIIKNISNLLVILLFFILTFCVTAYLIRDMNLSKILYWLNDNTFIKMNFNVYPFNMHRNSLHNVNGLNIEKYRTQFACGTLLFWYYVIPITLAMQIRKMKKIFLLVSFIILTIFLIKEQPGFFFALETPSKIFFINFIIAYILLIITLLICIIIPKRVNFK